MGQKVFCMRGFDEFKAAALDERDVAPREFDLQVEGVETGAEQHRDFPSGVPSSWISKMRCATNRDCVFSSTALANTGVAPCSLRVNKVLGYFSVASPITSFARLRIGCVLR